MVIDCPLFQSTRPTWGATLGYRLNNPGNLFQSTRPTWGATLGSNLVAPWHLFQSTRPTWGATQPRDHVPQARIVSIHAPHVGRD